VTTTSASLLKATISGGNIELAAIDEATEVGDAVCGDSTRTGDEECDDGNTAANDGCSPTCKVEGGYQCLPLEVNGKDMCVACGDKQCTTSFSLQSRCMDTASSLEMTKPDLSVEDAAAGTAQAAEDDSNPPVDEKIRRMGLVEFLQTKTGAGGAYERASNGFCQCAPDYCKSPITTTTFTCKSTAKGWARTSLTDDTCACAPGFCAMEIAGVTPTQKHCTPLHDNMIRDDAGNCACRPAVAAVTSSDPTLAVMAKPAACKINPTKPIVVVPGGKDEFGTFECVGAPYVKDASGDNCAQCDSTDGKSCSMARSQGSNQFLCFDVTTGTAEASAPYTRNGAGECECGNDQCLMPNGDHEVCRDLKSAFPYGPMKHSDGKCGCSSDENVCKLSVTGGFRCVHITSDNFARNYRRGTNGDCECKANMCIAANHPDNGALQCEDASLDSPYQRTAGTFSCECKPGACKFPGSGCKKCPTVPGHCETKCHESSATDVECVKFCRTKVINKQMVRATAQGQLQSVKKTIAREIGCFVQKVTTCQITSTSKTCTQVKSAKALYDCPAAESGSEPLRLRDGTETYGYTSMCDRSDLECQIQNCGRLPDSNQCQPSLLLI
jgi:cysteine-rich repeat protein